MALSIKKKGFSALLMVIAISLAMGMVWTPDTFGESERLVVTLANTYSLTIELNEAGVLAAQTYLNGLNGNGDCNLDLGATNIAVVELVDRFVRDGEGKGLGEDMTARLFLGVLDNSPPGDSPIETLVLVGWFSNNQDLIDYLIEDWGTMPSGTSASEITGSYEEKTGESGTKVKGKMQVLDSNVIIEFRTKFMKSKPELHPLEASTAANFFELSPYPLRFWSIPCRYFRSYQHGILYRYETPQVGVSIDIDISLDASSPIAAIFNGQDNVVEFRFSHGVGITDEIKISP